MECEDIQIFEPPKFPLLDTLAQVATFLSSPSTTSEDKPSEIGEKPTGKKTLFKRARSKFITNNISAKLADLHTGLEKSYWNSWHCAEVLVQVKKEITSKYCGNRWCFTCNRIRTAKLINGYIEPLKALDDKRFVTLTLRNVSAEALKETLIEMAKTFKGVMKTLEKRYRSSKTLTKRLLKRLEREEAMVETLMKRFQSGKTLTKRLSKRLERAEAMVETLTKRSQEPEALSKRLVGIKKLEITFNPKTLTFHPHYHLSVSGKEVAEQVIDEWLYRLNPDQEEVVDEVRRELAKFPKPKKEDKKKYIYLGPEIEARRKLLKADPQFQDEVPADDKSVMELFKYFTKMATNKVFHLKALDTIFSVMRNKRVFQPMGLKKDVSEEIDEIQEQIYADLEDAEAYWEWMDEETDWVDQTTGECRTGYKPSDNVLKLVDSTC